jgi:hypothetical protein
MIRAVAGANRIRLPGRMMVDGVDRGGVGGFLLLRRKAAHRPEHHVLVASIGVIPGRAEREPGI